MMVNFASLLPSRIRGKASLVRDSFMKNSIVRSCGLTTLSTPSPLMQEANHVQSKPVKEFYMRDLPESCISFSSIQGKRLFQEAMADGNMECYFPLAAQFRTQEEPAFCGLTTLVMTLNALSIDPRRLWKGSWRWYSEDMLECCLPFSVVKEKGIDVDTFVCMARCNAAYSDLVRPTKSAGASQSAYEEESFRNAVKQASKQSNGSFMVLSYSRKALGQTGDGHFSPLGGYHEATDSVLVLDVARFKYPPHWVPLKTIWKGMQAVDVETGLPRGYITVRRMASAPLLLFSLPSSSGRLDCGDSTSEFQLQQQNSIKPCYNKQISNALNQGLLECREELVRHVHTVISKVDEVRYVIDAVNIFISYLEKSTGGNILGSIYVEDSRCVDKLSKEHINITYSLLENIEALPVFKVVEHALVSGVSSNHSKHRDTDSEGSTHSCATCSSTTSKDGKSSILLSTSISKEQTAIIEAVMQAAGELAKTSPVAAKAAVRAACDSHGVSCVQVKKSHVYSMLLLAFSARSNGVNFPEDSLAARLSRGISTQLSASSDILKTEALAIHDQLKSANCSLL